MGDSRQRVVNMTSEQSGDNAAFRRFLRRVWRQDVTPLLRGARAAQRKKAARTAGKFAAATGLFVDSVLGLKGRPFARFMTVMGSSLGALLPDVWDWQWLRETAAPAQRKVVAEQMRRRAAELPEAAALELFGLPASAAPEDLKRAWREVLQRWHPDKARSRAARAEYHVRFLVYKTAYERLCQAYEDGRLPIQ
jgi:hypothetical protein